MGLGRFGGGVDAAEFARSCGAKVVVTDLSGPDELAGPLKKLEHLANIEYRLGSHAREDFARADVIIVNPAVVPENKYLQYAREQGKVLTSQIEIFFDQCPATIVGITGSNGKSTTSALTAHLLRAGLGAKDCPYANVYLSGNIGNQPLLGLLERLKADDLVVLELSSFQLEQLAAGRKGPKAALITNLTPNHLDRHKTFSAYGDAKENIFRLQSLSQECPAVSIFNADDPVCSKWYDKYKDQAGRVCLTFSAADVSSELKDVFNLPGRANLENLAAALAVAGHFGAGTAVIRNALGRFESLPHRLERVAAIKGVTWYNDSIATTPQSTIAALEAFDEPKVLIVGGYDKGLDFGELGAKIAEKAQAVVLLGQTADAIASAIGAATGGKVELRVADSLPQAVNLAGSLAGPGSVVLLSPACASYDMFDNFQQRGEIFRQLVSSLGEQSSQATKAP